MTAAEGAFSQLHVAERAPIYAWLSRLLVCEIQASDWDAMGAGPIPAVLMRLEPALEKELGGPLRAEQEERLAEEFARLFLLPGGVSPFASSWLTLRGEDASGQANPAENLAPRTREAIAARIAHALQTLGREPVRHEPWGRLPLDHFGVVLDLIAQAAVAETNGADQSFAIQLERELLEPCLTAFGERLADESREPLYRAIGRLISELHT